MNAQLTTRIANHLQVSPNQIKEIREWAKVFWVAVHGKRPTFVSKKLVSTMISLEEAQRIYGDPEAIQRNYLNQEVLEAAYQMAKELQNEGLGHLVGDSCSYPATWSVTAKYQDSMRNRQFNACDRIAAHLISANLV